MTMCRIRLEKLLFLNKADLFVYSSKLNKVIKWKVKFKKKRMKSLKINKK